MKQLYKKIKLSLQQFRIFLGRLILNKKPTRQWREDKLANSKILFIRHDGKIGDFLVSSFIYREIKKQYPSIHIGVVVAAETYDLFTTDPYIDSLYITPKRSLLSFMTVGLKIRKEKYDIVVDLTDFLRNRDLMLIRCVNACINIGHNQDHLELFNRNLPYQNKHITFDYERAMMLLGFQKMDRSFSLPNIPVSAELELFRQTHLVKDYIAINFFGAANHKKFSLNQQIKWLDRLNEIYPDKLILVLTYSQVTKELKENLPVGRYVMFESTRSIFDSIELIKNASMVISPDTAIVHATSALNKPMIGFYMSHDPQNPYCKWLPMNDKNSTIYFYQNNINEIDIEKIKLN